MASRPLVSDLATGRGPVTIDQNGFLVDMLQEFTNQALRFVEANSNVRSTEADRRYEQRFEAQQKINDDIRAEIKAQVLSVLDQILSRVSAMDKASEVLAENVNRVPTLLDREIIGLRAQSELRIQTLKDLILSMLDGVQTQFKERDERTKASDDASKLAIKDALQAQKESAAATQLSNDAAISKSEAGFKDQIRALDQKMDTTKVALDGQINSLKDALVVGLNDIKERVGRLEQQNTTARESRSDARESRTDDRGSVGMIVGIVMGGVGLLGVLVSVLIFEAGSRTPQYIPATVAIPAPR